MRVCVIGAGVAGLVTVKVMKNAGFDVTVFDKESSIGGVWAPSRAYPGLRTNNPRETYAFSDWPHPETSDTFPTAAQVRDYLGSYVERWGIGAHLRLSTEVVSVSRGPPNDAGSHPGFRVTVRPTNATSSTSTHSFDFVVVCNGVFSEPFVPHVEGQERFAGSRLHSSEIVDPGLLEERRVIVVGAGKSALDCATAAAHRGRSSTLLFRKPHWILPRYFFGRVRVDRVFFTRASEMLLPAYHRATRTEAALRSLAAPFLWLWRKGMSGLVRRLSGMPRSMTPDTPVTSGAENIGIGEEFYRALREGQVRAKRAEIVAFGEETVRLERGEELDTDLVVFATGWRQGVPFLAPRLQQDIQENGSFHLFRRILPPRERRLGFVGYASSANCPLTSEIAANWLARCFRGEMELPGPGDMDREIARVRAWSAKVFPNRTEGYFIGAYVAQYIDELMRDMRLPTRQGPNLLAEYLTPIWADRYAGVTEP